MDDDQENNRFKAISRSLAKPLAKLILYLLKALIVGSCFLLLKCCLCCLSCCVDEDESKIQEQQTTEPLTDVTTNGIRR